MLKEDGRKEAEREEQARREVKRSTKKATIDEAAKCGMKKQELVSLIKINSYAVA